MAYTYRDLLDAYAKLGVSKGKLVYVLSDLRQLMEFDKPGKALLAAHVDALRELLGPDGTIVMAASSLNLCNTDIPFDLDATPCHNVGVLAEYFRKLPGSIRSFHPFISVCANGPLAEEITQHISRHAFGLETPQDRLVKNDALLISIGLPPNCTTTTIHHVEQLMAVPYRYTKEYIHPVLRDGVIALEPFYRYVWYRDIGVEHCWNTKIFERIGHDLDIREVDVGRGIIYSFSLRKFFDLAVKAFAEDIFIWCKSEPPEKPYRE